MTIGCFGVRWLDIPLFDKEQPIGDDLEIDPVSLSSVTRLTKRSRAAALQRWENLSGSRPWDSFRRRDTL